MYKPEEQRMRLGHGVSKVGANALQSVHDRRENLDSQLYREELPLPKAAGVVGVDLLFLRTP